MDDIERRLRGEVPEERRRAVTEIPQAPNGEWPRLLVRALGDSDWRVRKEAVAAYELVYAALGA